MTEKRYYLACLDLEGRSALVVGGGPVGLEKAQSLVECGARVTVVAPLMISDLHELPVEILRRRYESGDLDGRFLVVSATGDPAVDGQVFEDAERANVPCNVADGPAHCSFILPAVHRVGPIAVGISTGGASPALAQRLRDEIAAVVTEEHAELARHLRDLRPWARQNLPDYAARKAYFDALVAQALP